MKYRFKYLLFGKVLWTAFGTAHYFIASFAELTVDFTQWSVPTRVVFAVFGFCAAVIGLIIWRADFYNEPKPKRLKIDAAFNRLEESPDFKVAEIRDDIICPKCKRFHEDTGEWAKRLHRTHLCENCGCEWTPHDHYTFGIIKIDYDDEDNLA